MERESLIKLFDYHYWANRQLWHSAIALTDWQFTRTLDDGSPSVQAQIINMVAYENLWVNYLWHGEIEFLHEAQLPTRASIRQEWDALEEEIRDFLDEQGPSELQRPFEPPFLPNPAPLKMWEVLIQIVHHAVGCRAQLCPQLARLGALPPGCDYFDYLAQQATPVLAAQPVGQWAAPQISHR